jgi:hypothetical protein
MNGCPVHSTPCDVRDSRYLIPLMTMNRREWGTRFRGRLTLEFLADGVNEVLGRFVYADRRGMRI